MGPATEEAIRILKTPDGRSDDTLLRAVKQVIGYMPTHGIIGDREVNSKDLMTDIREFASLLK